MRKHESASDALAGHEKGERSTRIVIVITILMMIGEIAAGTFFGSMALLADGWHMSTHVAAFGITLFAYGYARKHAGDPFFKFGTGKVSVLGGFASAVALVVVAAVMALESLGRLFAPEPIQFNEAIVVAIVGLLVNLGCAKILHDSGHDHGHAHPHDHDHEDDDHHHHHDHHHDHNLRAAYLHVLADALTSVFAIVALLVGKFYGWVWMDALMGIVGAVVISKWAWGLLSETSSILLDGGEFAERESAVSKAVESLSGIQVLELRMWRTGSRHFMVSLSVEGASGRLAEMRQRLEEFEWISHSSIELRERE